MKLWGGGPLLTRTETRHRWGVFVGFPLALLFAIIASLSGQPQGWILATWFASLLCFAFAVVCSDLMRGQLRSSLERLREERFKHCPGCRYDLRTLPEHGKCPECAWEYSPSSLREAWEERYKEWLASGPVNDVG